MRRTFLAGLVLISLAACGGDAKEQPAVAQVRPSAVRRHATPKGKKAIASTRKTPAPEDTATARNPLLNH
jgi:hypothetical protein